MTVDSIGYDSANNKLCLKVNGADAVIPFSGESSCRMVVSMNGSTMYVNGTLYKDGVAVWNFNQYVGGGPTWTKDSGNY